MKRGSGATAAFVIEARLHSPDAGADLLRAIDPLLARLPGARGYILERRELTRDAFHFVALWERAEDAESFVAIEARQEHRAAIRAVHLDRTRYEFRAALYNFREREGRASVRRMASPSKSASSR